MPDPLLYLKSMGTAAIASTLFVLAIVVSMRPITVNRINLACVLGIAFGFGLGGYLIQIQPAWPPISGLDRFASLVLPAAIGIELLGGFARVPRWIVWLPRIALAVSCPRILLHNSAYLNDSNQQGDITAALALGGGVLAGCWAMYSRICARGAGLLIPLALAMSIQSAGLIVMMAGYLKGGAAAFPIAAAIVSTSLVVAIVTSRSGYSNHDDQLPIVGIGTVCLFGLLFIGHFFGRLSNGCAVSLFLTPMISCVTLIPVLRHRNPRIRVFIGLVLVSIPLVAALTIAKIDFDRTTGMLLR